MLALVLAIVVALAFAITVGLQDAANSVAALVSTRAARPGPALLFASFFSVLGAFLPSVAVAREIGNLVKLSGEDVVVVVGAAATAAALFDVVAWRKATPASGTHAIGGALAGAAIAVGGVHAVNWGSWESFRPKG